MPRSLGAQGWASPRNAVLGTAVVALLAATGAVSPARSAQDASCPSAVPVGEVARGMVVHGLTVTSGTTPDSFDGSVLGVLQDGIAPGLDMIMVKLSGSQITDAAGDVDKGIWAGMSGSPVYTQDGRLLGAVAYGLSWSPSDVAGVTPATEMKELLDSAPASAIRATASSSKKVAVPPATSERLVSQGAMTTAQASGGFERLPMPFSVSGLSNSHLQKAADRFGVKRPMVVGGSTSAAAAPTDIVAGGNVAASLSYGDITDAGIGTVTAVCGEEVLAFGHPMLFSGYSTLSMHGADAIYIQKDSVFGSFKVANPSAPVGRITGDHLAGIHGVTKGHPRRINVTSSVRATNGNSRDGKTVITYRPATPFLSAIHLLSNADRVLDEIGGGTATVNWTFDGTRADGTPWTFTHGDRFASRRDITFSSIFESYSQMSKILHNNFEKVRITDVHYDATYSSKFDALEIAKFEIKPAGKWITITSHRPARRVYAGTDLPVRVTLDPVRGTADPTRVKLSVHIPNARGGEGVLYVGGGDGSGTKASSFDELLTKLAAAPRNDTLAANLVFESRKGLIRDSDTQAVSNVVSGYEHVHLFVR
ncbi:MAG: hypothetical protein ACR2FP_03045 [Nocardioidaceae bacterium]